MKIPAAVLALLLVSSAPQDEKKDVLWKLVVAKAAEKTRGLENYKFTGKITVDGVPFLAEPVDFTGAFDKSKGFSASMGPLGALFRHEKKVAIKDPESGTWTKLRLGMKVGEGPLASRIPLVAAGLRPPHETLKKFEERFKELKKKDGEEKVGDVACVVYEGALTEAGVRASLPAGVGVMIGKGTFEGTGRVWIADGRFVRMIVDTKIAIEDKDATLDMTFSLSTEFADVGKATVEMPAEVKKLFED